MAAQISEELQAGDKIDNDRLAAIFGCSTQGGMRRSHETNTLVLVSKLVDSIYLNRWDGPTLHYTGMGQNGDQDINRSQNRTLAESNDNGISVYLFEVSKAQEYTYTGQVKLINPPYFEQQPGKDGIVRKTVIYPLGLIDGKTPLFNRGDLRAAHQKNLRAAKGLSDEEVEKRAHSNSRRGRSGPRNVTGKEYDRNPWVVEHAKRRAKGICQLCVKPAPFMNKQGEAYLEVHHIIWLSKEGPDTPSNTVALCPNCHRRMHIVNDKIDQKKLLAKVTPPGG